MVCRTAAYLIQDNGVDRSSRAIADARDIWGDALLAEREAARRSVDSLAKHSDEDLISDILDTPDDDRLGVNNEFITIALALLRRAGIDENTL